jgi:23S rRNA (uracil1939-C5)-methyltransferase
VADPLVSFVESRPAGAVVPPAAHVIIRRRAPSFFQANRFLAPVLSRRVVALTADGPVVDLYAGVGLFAVCLAASGWREVTAIESDAVSGADLALNARAFTPVLRVARDSVEAFLRRHPASPNATFIVDPPRTGMSRAALAGVIAAVPRRIVYVSCDVATLARDARRLLDANYGLTHLEALDLFPNTPHVEAIAVFDRS